MIYLFGSYADLRYAFSLIVGYFVTIIVQDKLTERSLWVVDPQQITIQLD